MKLDIVKVLAASLALLGAAATQAQTDNYPNKPVRIIVPYSAGGATDLIGRLLGQELSKRWGQPVLIENKVGASGMVGAQSVVAAAPDGYTLVVLTKQHAANPSLFQKVPFDVRRDLTHIAAVASAANVLVVYPNLGVRTVADLVKMAKAAPAPMSYASGGMGSSHQFTAEQFKRMAGINLTHIPYKGSAPAEADVAAGHVPMTIAPIASVLPLLKGGKVLPLAVTSRARSPLVPNVPTFAEAGVPMEYEAWFGISAPAGTPKPIVEKINRAIFDALDDPAVRERLIGMSLDLLPRTSPEHFAELIRTDVDFMAKVVKDADIKPE